MASSITPLQSMTAPPPEADTTLGDASSLANENTFLQLLIAQIKNQDPTQPMDSSAFLSQLAQFSQLEQLIGIRQDLDPTAAASTSGTSGTDGSSNNGTTKTGN